MRVPAWCPLCSGLMKGRSTHTWFDFGVCVHCYIQFVEHREERWRSGWRPSQDEVSAYVDALSSPAG